MCMSRCLSGQAWGLCFGRSHLWMLFGLQPITRMNICFMGMWMHFYHNVVFIIHPHASYGIHCPPRNYLNSPKWFLWWMERYHRIIIISKLLSSCSTFDISAATLASPYIHADLLIIILACVFNMGTRSPPSLDSYLNNSAIIKERGVWTPVMTELTLPVSVCSGSSSLAVLWAVPF